MGNSVIIFVNEYGNQKEVPMFSANGGIENYEKHFHRLERRSSHSEKRLFK